ncbi:hypothetical protein KC963_04600, partial [Candidatus Saccharibacteria bacterium]|nr:hypothetical protein [Candidatus Saccharibacteria bacterium]
HPIQRLHERQNLKRIAKIAPSVVQSIVEHVEEEAGTTLAVPIGKAPRWGMPPSEYARSVASYALFRLREGGAPYFANSVRFDDEQTHLASTEATHFGVNDNNWRNQLNPDGITLVFAHVSPQSVAQPPERVGL